MKKKVFNALGLMTGTSIDGIDLSLIKSDGIAEFTSILNNFYEFDNNLRVKIIGLRDQLNSIEDLKKYSSDLSKLDREITLFYARIINNFFKNQNHDIDFVGLHGQTIFHDAEKKISLQLGDGKLLSQLTQKIIISNFRQNDIDNGGQGAPLVPIFHRLISNIINKKFMTNYPMNIVNIGGISNVTKIIDEKISSYENFKAYDIGPGSCLIDEWVRKNSNRKFDDNGEFARAGQVNDLIFNQAVENFSNTSYDKSLDIKNYDISFARGLSLEDGCATITKFTAFLIAEGLRMVSNQDNLISKINILCGGGRKNQSLIDYLKFFLQDSSFKFTDIDEYELDGDYIESQAFGYLSIRSFLNLPISFPHTTRCKSPTLGGKINKNF
jgi:anhydro-N-acetylmuramic acid kinase